MARSLESYTHTMNIARGMLLVKNKEYTSAKYRDQHSLWCTKHDSAIYLEHIYLKNLSRLFLITQWQILSVWWINACHMLFGRLFCNCLWYWVDRVWLPVTQLLSLLKLFGDNKWAHDFRLRTSCLWLLPALYYTLLEEWPLVTYDKNIKCHVSPILQWKVHA